MKALCIALTGTAIAVALPAVQAGAAGETASAAVKLADGNDAGIVSFTEATAGVLIKFELKGLPPGPHAAKIHDSGKCDGDFSGAGPIYNPLGAKHGFLHDEGPMAGDLPNIHAGPDSNVVAEVLSPFLTLSAEAEETLFDADGSAIVIYEAADDYTSEPEGGAGKRIACGKISVK
jgi:superoxide dismutase, Cu-Zn family